MSTQRIFDRFLDSCTEDFHLILLCHAIGPITPNWAPCWSYLLLTIQVHNNTLQGLQRTALGPSPPKANPAVTNFKDLTCFIIFFIHVVYQIYQFFFPKKFDLGFIELGSTFVHDFTGESLDSLSMIFQ